MSEEQSEIVQRVDELEKLCQHQEKLLNSLVEYLERVDDKFKIDEANFFNWHDRLDELRRDELMQKDVNKAKQFLKNHGYLVVHDENEIDAQKLRQWLTKKDVD